MAQFSSVPRTHIGEDSYQILHQYLKDQTTSQIFILTDSNTERFCLPHFLQKLSTEIKIEVVVMEAGEENKNIDVCEQIWKSMSDLGADRKSLMINLGGGVVTDLGGFIAATFKRGVKCIHFPTTLLSMVDAALGGKNGINLDSLKNQVGTIQQPELVLIDPFYLRTLASAEMRSGLAEMLKHGLIADTKYWSQLKDLDQLQVEDLPGLIWRSVEIKTAIVEKDPREENLRKSLNFGHTLGHAIESFRLHQENKPKLLHGEAIAIGMVLAAYLSKLRTGLPEEICQDIKQRLLDIYEKVEIDEFEQQEIIKLLKFDKKNEHGKINFVLLRQIGEPVIDCEVSNEEILDAFKYYLD